MPRASSVSGATMVSGLLAANRTSSRPLTLPFARLYRERRTPPCSWVGAGRKGARVANESFSVGQSPGTDRSATSVIGHDSC